MEKAMSQIMDPRMSPINIATLSGAIDSGKSITEIRLPDGSTVQIETSTLLSGQRQQGGSDRALAQDTGVTVIPLIEEQLVVGRHVIETGKVRLIKRETMYEEQLNEPLMSRTFEVERIVINQPVDEVPTVRQEGETTIYPVVEEQLVLTKRLVLSEEVRVTRRDVEGIDTQTVMLRKEHLTVERENFTKAGA